MTESWYEPNGELHPLRVLRMALCEQPAGGSIVGRAIRYLKQQGVKEEAYRLAA